MNRTVHQLRCQWFEAIATTPVIDHSCYINIHLKYSISLNIYDTQIWLIKKFFFLIFFFSKYWGEISLFKFLTHFPSLSHTKKKKKKKKKSMRYLHLRNQLAHLKSKYLHIYIKPSFFYHNKPSLVYFHHLLIIILMYLLSLV